MFWCKGPIQQSSKKSPAVCVVMVVTQCNGSVQCAKTAVQCAVSRVQCAMAVVQQQTNDIQSFLAALIADGIMTSSPPGFLTPTSLSSMLAILPRSPCIVSAGSFFHSLPTQLVCHPASLAPAPSEEEQMGDYDNLGLSPNPLSPARDLLTDCHIPLPV